ncbi:hypothetical protein MPSEU_000285300 [Mayamaea pseudoterrestris]|nr:hypothetical protein MPSEU_000285300 [Mayamaea pseudoterrestris]
MRTRRYALACILLACFAPLSCVAFTITRESSLTPHRKALLHPNQAANDSCCHRACARRPTTKLFVWGQDEELRGSNRIKACVPYLLPLIDGDVFGQYIYGRIPILGDISDFILGPLVQMHDKIPFFSIFFFIALTLGTRFNTEMDRNVRFSAQQAALLDALLIVPELIRESFIDDPVPRYLSEPCSNFVWYAYMSAVVYSVYCNLRGKRPDKLPYVSEVADLMVGPY